VSFVAGSLIIDSIWEESIEAEAN